MELKHFKIRQKFFCQFAKNDSGGRRSGQMFQPKFGSFLELKPKIALLHSVTEVMVKNCSHNTMSLTLKPATEKLHFLPFESVVQDNRSPNL